MIPLDATVPGDARRLTDPQWFSLSWYGQPIEVLCRSRGLERVHPERGLPPELEPLPSAHSGHLVAVSPGLRGAVDPDHAHTDTVIVGGPCIGDAGAGPTLEALYDVVEPLRAGLALGRPVVLYVGDEEEAMERGGSGRRWFDLGERVAGWIGDVAAALGVSDVRVIRTSDPEHAAALAAALPALQGVGGPALDAAFQLAPGVAAAGSDASRQVTRRVIAAHLPSVVARHVESVGGSGGGEGGEGGGGGGGGRGEARAAGVLETAGRRVRVLVAENLQQAGVVEIARACARRIDGDATPSAGAIELLAHWPAPGLSATERMYRSGAWDKVPATDLDAVAIGDVSGMHPYTCEFFATWLPREVRRSLVAVTARRFEAS